MRIQCATQDRSTATLAAALHLTECLRQSGQPDSLVTAVSAGDGDGSIFYTFRGFERKIIVAEFSSGGPWHRLENGAICVIDAWSDMDESIKEIVEADISANG